MSRILPRLLLLHGLLYPVMLQAQNDSTHYSLALKLSPQHLLTSGLYLEAERPLGNSPGSICFGPQVYRGSISSQGGLFKRESDSEKISGLGGHVYYRHYLGRNASRHRGAFVGAGAQFQYFDLSWEQTEYRPVESPDGLIYYTSGRYSYTERISKPSGAVIIGIQDQLAGRIMLDFFAGIGLTQSTVSSTYHTAPRYAENLLDLGHSGLFLPLGFRVAYMLGKKE